MADRWSNPSGSKGVHRFRVWPSSTDTYNHEELADNWDMLDAIIGIPAVGTWPTTLGVGGGIYAEIKLAKEKAIPIGSVYPWYRPFEDTDPPDGWEFCDGSTVSDHGFGTAGSITLPDLRNKFIIGANPDTIIGTAGVAITATTIEAAGGAPGPGGVGGNNSIALSLAQLAAHQHTGSTTGWSSAQHQWYNPSDGKYPQAGNYTYHNGAGPNESIGTGQGGYLSGQHRHKLNSIASEGGGMVHDNRPLYVGLIYIMKVRDPS